ncbi:hypothetical protein PG984_014097 [Apiospora sp. TS-2023a]
MTARVQRVLVLSIHQFAEQLKVVAGTGVLFQALLHHVPLGQGVAEEHAHGRAVKQGTQDFSGGLLPIVRLSSLDDRDLAMRSSTSGNAVKEVLEGGLATSDLLGGGVNVAESVRGLLISAYSTVTSTGDDLTNSKLAVTINALSLLLGLFQVLCSALKGLS